METNAPRASGRTRRAVTETPSCVLPKRPSFERKKDNGAVASTRTHTPRGEEVSLFFFFVFFSSPPETSLSPPSESVFASFPAESGRVRGREARSRVFVSSAASSFRPSDKSARAGRSSGNVAPSAIRGFGKKKTVNRGAASSGETRAFNRHSARNASSVRPRSSASGSPPGASSIPNPKSRRALVFAPERSSASRRNNPPRHFWVALTLRRSMEKVLFVSNARLESAPPQPL